MTQSPEAVRARVARRRHMQQRQTVIFGTLVTVLLVAGLLGGAVWSGVLPSPIDIEINSGAPEATPAPVAPPCPPEGALPVPYSEISANVLNGTETQGLAAGTAATLRSYGIQTGREQNGQRYEGVARLTAGPLGVASAYTLAALFSSAEIVLDAREDATVDVLLGMAFEDVLPLEQVELDPEAPIPPPADCRPVETPAEDEG
ncbi:MAG TPA: LytR C-terminal domain-containing protein [Actinotalea caeni]|uniref:LytR C-terminal domain-containing protein n=1 Tax=Actinotalea caeni TaxID=1348467 RepID=UPI001F0481A9|nr:LytR C-terminal domain-containing protein [Actinotalea caeni]HLV56998.1 LytR C-terminal domain-containing protein [Actinotalea caeni]